MIYQAIVFTLIPLRPIFFMFYTCVQRARLLDVSGVLLRGELIQEQAVRDMHGTEPK